MGFGERQLSWENFYTKMQETGVQLPPQPITGFLKFTAGIRDLSGSDGRVSFFLLQAGVDFYSTQFGFGSACHIWGNDLGANGALPGVFHVIYRLLY